MGWLLAKDSWSIISFIFPEPWQIVMTSSMLDWLLTEFTTTELLTLPV